MKKHKFIILNNVCMWSSAIPIYATLTWKKQIVSQYAWWHLFRSLHLMTKVNDIHLWIHSPQCYFIINLLKPLQKFFLQIYDFKALRTQPIVS